LATLDAEQDGVVVVVVDEDQLALVRRLQQVGAREGRRGDEVPLPRRVAEYDRWLERQTLEDRLAALEALDR
jgi:hypothetical protein